MRDAARPVSILPFIAYQPVLADASHASEYQSEYQSNTSDFDCHTPRTEDAKPSSSRDTDRNTSE